MASVGDAIDYAPVTRAYRRWLAWALAIVLHLAILGVVASWTLSPEVAPRASIDVVLVSQPAQQTVDSDSIAEADQQARGDSAASAAAASLSAADPAQAAPAASELTPQLSAAPLAEVLSASQGEPSPTRGDPALAQEPTRAEPRPAAPAAARDSRDPLGQAALSLRQQGEAATLAAEQPGEARQAAREAAESSYIEAWTRRIEAYGNRDYPAPANLDGELRIRVVVGRDGQLRQAEVVQSSLHPELDRVALATVHGAAPYPPFGDALGELDSLSITRVWRFGKGNHIGVQ
ncbi:TonB family protein [Franzmannia qiaohouensis]|uniref:TonB family protein n=1 Tax=Franzmannia qiaohouensis TaxID=1329370 RepID=A0ABU1H8S6_9GAMM|nr:TonB family protein [Halomonas qiaohouensis]MDR5903858.1 TonB family protein [Halomonas qiaohouensis]